MAGLLDFAGSTPSGGGGLLDFVFSDPGARAGLTMLAASSPKYGRGLLAAMQSQDQMQQQAMQRQLLQSQIAENASQAKMRDQQLAMAQQKQNMLASIFGGPGALAGVTTGGGLNVPSGGAQGGGIENLTLSQVAALKANGIDVADLWKFGKEGIKREAGNYYQNPTTNETQYLPKLDNGMAVSNGQVVDAPGYAQANARIKGSEAGAIEAAKFPYAVGQDSARQNLTARLDPTKVYNPQTGREEFVPRAAVVAQPQYSGAGYNGGSAANAAVEQLQTMQSELNKLPPNHPDRPAIMREMQRLGGGQAQSGNYAAGPSAAEAAANEAARTRAVEQVKADISPTATKIAAVDTARDALNVIDQALNHPGLKTATGVSGTLDPRNYVPGTDATNFRVLMDQVKGGVFLDAFKDLKGGGAITEAEGAKAEAAKARINRAQSPDEFVKGLSEYKAIVERGLQRAQARNTGGASGEWDEKPKADSQKREFSMLPNAKQYDGKRMQAPDGTIYRSRGGQWVKE